MNQEIIRQDLSNIYGRCINWEKLKDAKVLVTGSNGLIAYYIIRMLIFLNDEHNMNITILAHARNRDKMTAKYHEMIDRDDVKLIIQDITDQFELDEKIDYIIHTASPTGPQQFAKTPVETALANIYGTNNVLELAKQHQVKAFLLLSTREIYGKGSKDFVLEEDYGALDPTSTRSCYPEGKRMAENLCMCYKEEYGVESRIVRIAHTYGPTMLLRDGRVVGDFLGNVVDGKSIVMNSDGSGTLALTYIADVIAGIFMSILNWESDVYNVSNSNETITVKELAHCLSDMYGDRGIKVVQNEVPAGEKKGYLSYKLGFLDSKKAESKGWTSQYTLKEGLRRTVSYYCDDSDKTII